MIAPLPGSRDQPRQGPQEPLKMARRIVAAALLGTPDKPRPRGVPAWQAWLFALWMAGITAAYAAAMAGLWKP